MALLYTDGFDAGDFALRATTYTGNVATSTATRFGTGLCLSVRDRPNNGVYAKSLPVQVATLYAGFALSISNDNGINTYDMLALQADGGTTTHITLRLINRGMMALYLHNSLVASGACTPLVGTWNYIELSSNIAASGNAIVRVNGVEIINYTGSTQNGGTNTTFDQITLYGLNNNNYAYYDDLYICDSTGTANNSFLGDIKVQLLSPNGAGTTTQLAPTGSATNYLNVNDIPDSTSTYNSASTSGQRDTYAMADLNSTSYTVFGMQQNMIAAKASTSGQAGFKPALQIGGAVYYGATQPLGTSFAWHGNMFEENPATTAAWTGIDVNGTEAGAEVA